MILSRRVALGGVQLDELDASIVIRSVDPGMARENVTAVNRMGGAGQRVTFRHWETIEANVSFAIDLPKRQLAARKQIWDKVIAWANRKGWLTFNYIEGRRLYVDQVIYPDSGDLWAWTDEFTLTFRAYNVPFWQDETPASVTGDVTNGRLWLEIPGNVRGVLDLTAQNISGMGIQNFKVTAGGCVIELKGINLGGAETLSISHGTDGLLRITAGGRNLYSMYQGSDDLFVYPGSCAIDIATQRAVRVTAACYGRWIG